MDVFKKIYILVNTYSPLTMGITDHEIKKQSIQI
jgi:hypothetical protein